MMITGDNPLTAAAIARSGRCRCFLAEASRRQDGAHQAEQAKGRVVAIDRRWHQRRPLPWRSRCRRRHEYWDAAQRSRNMVDLDSNPTQLIEISKSANNY